MRPLYIKILLFVMFISGVVQLRVIELSWTYFRTTQAVHIIVSIIIMLFLVIPFIYKHIEKYFFLKK